MAVTQQQAINALINIAVAEIDYLEKASNSQLDDKTANAGSANYTKYWRDVEPSSNGQYWCACFVSWCFMKAFGEATAKSLLKHWPYTYCDNMRSFFSLKDKPSVGDVVVFWSNKDNRYNHTGIVIAANGDSYTTVEGNATTSSATNNGGGVVQKPYTVQSRRAKFATPDWSQVSTVNASTSGSMINTGTTTGNVAITLPGIQEETKLDAYSTRISSKDYLTNLSKGLRVEDLRGIFGMPHQFLPTTDPRIDGTSEYGAFGRKYTEKIIAPIPLLLMTPGSPVFMTAYSKQTRMDIVGKIITDATDSLKDTLSAGSSGKYFTLKYDYTNYFYYVNAMLRSAAYFLGIQNETIDGKTLGTFNWLYDNTSEGNTDIFGHAGLQRFLGTYAGAIPFYVNSETSVNDSFSNSTTQSMLASTINGLSDSGRELNFVLGAVDGVAGTKLQSTMEQSGLVGNLETLGQSVADIFSGNTGNVISTVLGGASTLLSGGKLAFPEIWSDSSFSRSYNVNMKLVSPTGNKLDVFLNILVPIYHLLAFALPRASQGQGYVSPFLVRAYYKGLFNVDMGIISDISVTKGAEGEWTVDGIPTVAEVSFEIKDLYDELYISTAKDKNDLNIMNNISELDYIANSCGINVNEPEIRRTIEMYVALNITGNISDSLTIGIFGNITQFFNNKLNDIFGKF